ncbi:MAG: hypothetical protein H7175_06775, partial [Burkholderiales bacterium]|nr:hypothetical protein [Anaerolineae bacterium]
LVVGFGALVLLARIQISDDARKMLLIGWVLAFYWALSMWDSENRARAFREELRHEPPVETRVVDEFFDTDRVVLKHAVGDSEAQIDDQMEMV